MLACVALLVAPELGCNSAKRDAVLTFFFDGVHDPVDDDWQQERAMRAAAFALEDQDDGRTPDTMNPCSQCHVYAETQYASVGPQGTERPLAAPAAAAPSRTANAETPPGAAGYERASGLTVISAPPGGMSAPPPAGRDAAATASSSMKASTQSLAGTRDNVAGINVQVAAFAKPENAAALKTALQREFPNVRVDEIPAHGKLWHRVLVGPLATNAEASRIEERLRAMGHVTVRYGRVGRSE